MRKPSQPIGSIIRNEQEIQRSANVLTTFRQPGYGDELSEFLNVVSELAAIAPEAAKIGQLRRRYGDDRASLLMSVASLQTKARKKLGEGVWFVTPKSLQQATPWQVAQHKARWFSDRRVMDLCCGIGGDAARLAQRGPLVAVDTDNELVCMTQANLISHTSSDADAEAVCADARQIAITNDCGIHIDPDRRNSQRRTTRPDQYLPPWDDVVRIVDQAMGAVVKLAPAAQVDARTSQRAQRAWFSLQGTVREQSVLLGDARQGDAGTRIAISLAHDGSAEHFSATMTNQPTSKANRLGEFLIDPDAAIRAAGLTETFAITHGLATIAGPAGFLTCDQLPSDVGLMKMAVIGHVLWSGACDDRKLRRELRQRNMYPMTIKARGTEHDPAELTKRWRECGQRPITLWIGRTASRRFAAITEPA